MPKKLFRKSSIPFLILIITAFALRVYKISQNDLWYDEVMSLLIAKKAPFIWNPPLYYILLKLLFPFFKIFGISEFSLRLPSAIFSTLALIPLYILAKEMFNKKTALMAAALMALSPFHIWYAQEGRTYALTLLLSLLSSLFFYYYIAKRKFLPQYILFASLSLYSHYYCIILIIFQFAFLIYKNLISRKYLFYFSLSIVPLIVPFSQKLLSIINKGFWIQKPTMLSLGITYSNFLIGYNGNHILYILSSFVILATLCLIAKDILIVKHLNKTLKLCLILCVGPVILVFVISRVFFSFYLDRGFIIISPFFYIIVSYYLLSIKRPQKILLIILILGTSLWPIVRYYKGTFYSPSATKYHVGVLPKKPFKPLAGYISRQIKKGRVVIVTNMCAMPPLLYYLITKYKLKKNNILGKIMFAFDPESINDFTQRKYRETPLKTNAIKTVNMYKLKNTLSKMNEKYCVLVACDWQRTGILKNNSKRIANYFANNALLLSRKEFSGIKVYEYKIR